MPTTYRRSDGKLGMDTAVYAGFSAGGLAAYLAAGQDASADGYLGLDSVDSGDLAVLTACFNLS